MEKRYITTNFDNAEEIIESLEENYSLHGTLDSIDTPGTIYEVTVKRVGTSRQTWEVELDPTES